MTAHDHEHPHAHAHAHAHAHSHDHPHDPRQPHPFQPDTEDSPVSEPRVMAQAIHELLLEKGVFTAEAYRRMTEFLDTKTTVNGARMVARAWSDPAYRDLVLTDVREAAKAFGIDTGVVEIRALPDTPGVHNVIVCTLCSCYPTGLLGAPPDWYKAREYRSRVVREPHTVLKEFGTTIPAGVELRVHDSSADLRYFVLPLRPAGTEGWDEDKLAELVTRDVLIGTALPQA